MNPLMPSHFNYVPIILFFRIDTLIDASVSHWIGMLNAIIDYPYVTVVLLQVQHERCISS